MENRVRGGPRDGNCKNQEDLPVSSQRVAMLSTVDGDVSMWIIISMACGDNDENKTKRWCAWRMRRWCKNKWW